MKQCNIINKFKLLSEIVYLQKLKFTSYIQNKFVKLYRNIWGKKIQNQYNIEWPVDLKSHITSNRNICFTDQVTPMFCGYYISCFQNQKFTTRKTKWNKSFPTISILYILKVVFLLCILLHNLFKFMICLLLSLFFVCLVYFMLFIKFYVIINF